MWINPDNASEFTKQPSHNYIPHFSAEQTSESISLSNTNPHTNDSTNKKRPQDNTHSKSSHAKHTVQNRHLRTSPKLCIIFYAIGCLLSGIFLAALSTEQQATILVYFQQLFSAQNLQPLSRFFSLAVPAMLQIVLILLFGFCTFGAPLIAGVIVLSGIASGALAFVWLSQYGLLGLIHYTVSIGLFQAILAVIVCRLGQRGIVLSTKLFSQIFSNKPQTEQRFNLYFVKRFLRCSLATTAFALTACCLSTAIAILTQTLLPTV